jgi:glutathione synthase/RimK-type ligase-like ATP-grasp enzyme
MVPNTRVLFRSSHLQKILSKYAEKKVQKAVIKEDRASLGTGVHPCESLTELAYKAIHVTSRPVVIQPMLEKFREFRLVIVEDTIVGMEKTRANGVFWNNKFLGGATKFITPSSQIIEFGEEMMRMGKFPWAYIDLFVADDKMYLSEINLSGSNRELKGYNLNNLKRQMVERWQKNK